MTSNLSLFRPFFCTISAANSHSIPWPSTEISSGSLGSRKRPSHEIQLLAIPQRQYPIHNFAGLPQIQLRNASSAGTPTLPRPGLCHRGSHLTSARLPFHLHNSLYRHSPAGLAFLSAPRLPRPYCQHSSSPNYHPFSIEPAASNRQTKRQQGSQCQLNVVDPSAPALINTNSAAQRLNGPTASSTVQRGKTTPRPRPDVSQSSAVGTVPATNATHGPVLPA